MTTSEHERDQILTEENADESVEEVEETEEVEEATEEEQDELAKVMAERDDYLDQLQRSRAEFVNYRKRTEMERLRMADLFRADTLKQFLPVIDDFERAVHAVPANEQKAGWMAGITMIQKKLAGVMERAGVEAVDALNQPFDPSLHEAVATEPGSKGDTVVEVYQKGYRLGDTLLRPAMVKTGDASPEPESDQSDEKFDA